MVLDEIGLGEVTGRDKNVSADSITDLVSTFDLRRIMVLIVLAFHRQGKYSKLSHLLGWHRLIDQDQRLVRRREQRRCVKVANLGEKEEGEEERGPNDQGDNQPPWHDQRQFPVAR